MNYVFALALCVAPIAPAAIAQTVLQSETKLYSQFVQGETNVCGLELTSAFREGATSSSVLGMSGSVSFANADNSLVSVIKVNAVQGATQVPVNSASLVVDGESLPLKQTSCLNRQALCGALYDDKVIKAIGALARNKLELRYNLHAGEKSFVIPVSPANANSMDERADFAKCMDAMVQTTLQNMSR